MSDLHLSHLPVDQRHLVRRVTARLEPQFAGTFGAETIERFVVDSLDKLLPSAKVTSFLDRRDRPRGGRRHHDGLW